MLFHISEVPDVECFEPRVAAGSSDAMVWAIDEQHLRNYLLPRECPRVTFYALETTTSADRTVLLGDARVVIAVEEAWLERIEQTQLYCYSFSPEEFRCIDAGAGYYVSTIPVLPVGVVAITNLLDALATRGVTVRVLSNLWPLHDAVAASSLQFSMIRMRNALPRVH